MDYKKVQIFRFLMGVMLLIVIATIAVKSGKECENGLTFSAESGFYDEAFYLEIGGGNGTIYYTLDSKDPNENSLVYAEPILISDASQNENVYCMIDDTALYYNQYLKNIGVMGEQGYSLPSTLIDKATILKAISIDKYGNKSEVITKVFFVGFNEKYGYDDVNVISIVTDPDNLFDYYTGIYVTGFTFDNYMLQLDSFDDFDYTWAPGNYRIQGNRKIADVKFWNVNRDLVEEGTFEISIQGGVLERIFLRILIYIVILFFRRKYYKMIVI